jgi:hypothetical protein
MQLNYNGFNIFKMNYSIHVHMLIVQEMSSFNKLLHVFY